MFTSVFGLIFNFGFLLAYSWKWAIGAYVVVIIYDLITLLVKIVNERITIRSLRKVLVEKRKNRN